MAARWLIPLTTMASLALIGCNQPPEGADVQIVPAQPDTLDDLVVQLVDEAVDPNDKDIVSYRYVWSVDGTVQDDLTGEIVPAERTARDQTWSVLVFAGDGKVEGEAATASVRIANTAPRTSVSVSPRRPDTSSSLLAAATSEDIDGDPVDLRWSWTVDGRDAGISGPEVPAERTARGQVWEVTVVPSDDELDGAEKRASVTILNTEPEVTSVTLDPVEVFEGTVLRAVVEASDVDGDDLDLHYTWFVNSLTVPAYDRNVLNGDAFDKGDIVVVEVYAEDGEADSDPRASEAIVVQNSPPSYARAVITPSVVNKTTGARCAGSGWADADGDPEGSRVVWQVEGRDVSTELAITGDHFARGQRLRCVLLPFDGEDEGAPVMSDTVVIGNSPPSIGVASLSTLSPREGDTINVSVTGASDPDGDRVSLIVEWYVDGSRVFTGSSLTSAWFDKGDQVWAVVTPTDGTDSGTPVTTARATVANTPPRITSLSLSPSTLYSSSSVTASVATTDADGDRVGVRYDWYLNGSRTGITSSTLPAAYHRRGDQVWVIATPNDGTDDGASVVSTRLTVLNSPPTTPGVSISTTTPSESDSLTCSLTRASTDPDGDGITYYYRWYRNGSYAGYTSSTLSGSITRSGERWNCDLRAWDGSAYSAAAVSATATVGTSWSGRRTFGTCGASGYDGPTQSQCNSAYLSTTLNGEVTVSGGKQLWTVPVSATYRIEAWGAQGASAQSGRYGGLGARMRGDVYLTAGTTLYIVVGQAGTSDGCSGGGGGGSFVSQGSGSALVVAGGGAGTRTSVSQNGCDAKTSTVAGTGSGSGSTWGCGSKSSSTIGYGGIVSSSSWGSGGGAWSRDGSYEYSSDNRGRGFTLGGRGGGNSSYRAYGGFGGGGGGNGSCGGGGGGGYSGGDGGRLAGGAGSYNGGGTQSNSGGARSGHGIVTIDKL